MDPDPKPSVIKSWLNSLRKHFLMEPDSLTELQSVVQDCVEKNILDVETLGMMEGVLAISKMQVRDIMIPRIQMAILEQSQSVEMMLKIVCNSPHSRFPMIGDNKDDVLGIILVKDFLKAYLHNKEVDIQKLLRPAHFVPESKRLDSLLKEFKASHNHLAIVVDEYGGISGLATIEDILEEIVGDIEDEFDEVGEAEIVKIVNGHYLVHGLTELEVLNDELHTDFQDDDINTIGGLMTRALGHIPRVGEAVLINDWEITALKADSRHILQVELKQKTKLVSQSSPTP